MGDSHGCCRHRNLDRSQSGGRGRGSVRARLLRVSKPTSRMNPAFSPFILRFQETCLDLGAVNASTGTTTITAVRAEEIDADPDKKRFGALPPPSVSAG